MRILIQLFGLFYVFFPIIINGQSLGYKEIPNKANVFKYEIINGKTLLIFESELDLDFSSSMEVIENIKKEGKIYKIHLSQRICVINIQEKKTASKTHISFGQITENSLPPLQNDEVKYFEIDFQKRLFAIEDNSKGSDSQMLYEKEALLIINTDPVDLQLDFHSTSKITEIKKDKGKYRLFILPENQTITITNKESGLINNITINNISVKDVKYYFVYLQDPSKKNVSQIEVITDKSIAVGSYIIDSKPSGATIEMYGNPSFNREKNKTPFRLDGYEAGPKIITLNLPEYEEVIDTIFIGKGRANKSEYILTPNFSFLKFNIIPSPPYSKVKVDGKEIDNVTNNSNMKVTKGDKQIEIIADHYYSENIVLTATAGKIYPINVSLKPKFGKLKIKNSKESIDSEVFIENNKLRITKTKIGTIPFSKDVELQEGDYNLIVSKKGFSSTVTPFTIREKLTTNIDVSMKKTKIILINTNVDKAEIIINGELAGKSNLKTEIGIGVNEIVINKENYYSVKETININETDETNKVYSYTLIPFKYFYNIQIEKDYSLRFGVRKLDIYSNNRLLAQDSLVANIALESGCNKIYIRTYLKDNQKKKCSSYSTTINVPTKNKSFKLPLYSNSSFSILSYEKFASDYGSILTLFAFTYYGIKVNALDFYDVSTINHYGNTQISSSVNLSGLGKIELRIGGGITRNIDICTFANYNHVDLTQREINYLDTSYVNIGSGNIFSYGLELQTRPKLINLFCKFGFQNSSIAYKNTSNYNNNRFFISFGGSLALGDNIFRLWKKPLFHNFIY